MDLRINQQDGLIGLNIKQPDFNMRVKHPRVNLDIKAPQLEIHQPAVRLEIDQTQCFADAGRRNIADFAKHRRDLAYAATMEAIAQIAAEGDMLGAIEKGINVADVARMQGPDWQEFDIAAVPSHRPIIDFFVQPVDVRLIEGKVLVNPDRGQVKGHLDWGRVNVIWRQKPAIDIEYVGNKFDKMT
ncbi:MAG: hypothetical protein GXY50_08620 [Syntrophomonadaceae bacterium]|nr:hypothetical protein [Syntrophomonadaceae bacterium]